MKKRTLAAITAAALLYGCGGGGGGGSSSPSTGKEDTQTPTSSYLTKAQVVQTLNEQGLSCEERDTTIANPNNGTIYISEPLTANISCDDNGMGALVSYGQSNSQAAQDEYNIGPINLQGEYITKLSKTEDKGLVKAIADEIKSTIPAPGFVVLDGNANPHTYAPEDLLDVFGIGDKRVFTDVYRSSDNSYVGTVEVFKDASSGNFRLPKLETRLSLDESSYVLDFRVQNELGTESEFPYAGAYTLSQPDEDGGTDTGGEDSPEL